MLEALADFMRGVKGMPTFWRMWLNVLMLFNFILPIFLIFHLEAQLTLVAAILNLLIGVYLCKLQGFTRLLGLMHVFWIPLVIFLWTRHAAIPTLSFFGLWIRGVIVLNIISLVIDATDIVRYLLGDRKSAI